MMRGGNRQMRRMLDKMGFDMNEIPNVLSVIIKTDKKEILLDKPNVMSMDGKDNTIFQIVADGYEEKELEVPIFSEQDIAVVCQRAKVSEEEAKNALAETNGDLARAIIMLDTN